MRSGALLLSVAVWLAGCAAPPRGELNVASTSEVVFAHDEEGRVIWRKKLPNARILQSGDSLYVAVSSIGGLMVVGDVRTGREFWRTKFDGRIMCWAVEPDSSGRAQVYAAVENPAHFDYFYFDYRDGKEHRHWTRLNEHPARVRKNIVCGPPRFKEEIWVTASAGTVFGFDRNAELRWKARLVAGERLEPVSKDEHVVLVGRNHIRVLHRLEGAELWARFFPSEVVSVTSAPDHVQVRLRDGGYRVMNMQNGRWLRNWVKRE